MARHTGNTLTGYLGRILILGLALLPLGFPLSVRAETRWVSGPSRIPDKIADPQENRSGVTWYPGDDRLSVLLGGLVPVVSFGSTGDGWGVMIEGGAVLELGMEGSYFPLETIDGRFGGRLEGSRGFGRAVLRIGHLSAHQADGDSTVAYRGRTVSRETWSLELGAAPPLGYAYFRAGTAWHSVPSSEGWNLAAGVERCLGSGTWGPVLGLSWTADAASGHRSGWSLFGGAGILHRNTVRAGIRWYHGPGPSSQYPERTVDRWGLEIHFRPEAPGDR